MVHKNFDSNFLLENSIEGEEWRDVKDEKLFAEYFNSSPKKLGLFISAELVGTY